MAGIGRGRRLQYGKESTKGTKVSAAAIWGGEVKGLEDARQIVNPKEDIGYILPRLRSYTPMLFGKLAIPPTPATFEQTPVILTSGVKKLVTGVADGSGSGYIYAYPAHYDADSLNDFTTFSWESGDNQQEEELEYGYVADFTLEGKAKEAWMLSANIEGRQVVPDTFTSALSVPAVLEEMLFGNSKLYIDDSGGTLGTTQKTLTFLAASIKWKTGLVPVFSGDGSLYFTFAKFGPAPEIMVEVTFEHDTTGVAEKLKWRSNATRLLRIKVEGSTLATAGTDYSKKTALLDFAGRWDKFDVLDEDENGDSIVKGTLRVGRSDTDSLGATITVVNELSSFP